MDRKVKVIVNLPDHKRVSWITDASGKRELITAQINQANMKTKDDLVEEALKILERFDFEKVHAYMSLMEWHVNNEVPAIVKMREESLLLLEIVINRWLTDDIKSIKAEVYQDFGLIASIENDGSRLSLSFYIERKLGIEV